MLLDQTAAFDTVDHTALIALNTVVVLQAKLLTGSGRTCLRGDSK